jgi:hypothetical protein
MEQLQQMDSLHLKELQDSKMQIRMVSLLSQIWGVLDRNQSSLMRINLQRKCLTNCVQRIQSTAKQYPQINKKSTKKLTNSIWEMIIKNREIWSCAIFENIMMV